MCYNCFGGPHPTGCVPEFGIRSGFGYWYARVCYTTALESAQWLDSALGGRVHTILLPLFCLLRSQDLAHAGHEAAGEPFSDPRDPQEDSKGTPSLGSG